jgi:hypothetical protein
LPLGVPELHTRDGSLWLGCVPPMQEKPIEAPVHPMMLESAVHPCTADVSTQQKSVKPPLPAVPMLQLRALLLASGLSLPEQE